MTEFEKGYAAGIIDGEGTVTLTKIHSTDKFRAPVVEVTSTTYAILEKMVELAGGSISTISKKQLNWKQAYKWEIKYDKAINFLTEIKDYLLEPKKKYRANIIVSTYKSVTPRNGKYSETKLAQKIKFEEDFFKEF